MRTARELRNKELCSVGFRDAGCMELYPADSVVSPDAPLLDTVPQLNFAVADKPIHIIGRGPSRNDAPGLDVTRWYLNPRKDEGPHETGFAVGLDSVYERRQAEWRPEHLPMLTMPRDVGYPKFCRGEWPWFMARLPDGHWFCYWFSASVMTMLAVYRTDLPVVLSGIDLSTDWYRKTQLGRWLCVLDHIEYHAPGRLTIEGALSEMWDEWRACHGVV